MTTDLLLSISQAAKMLSVSPWTLRKWDNEGKFKAVRIGKRRDRRYRLSDIKGLINNGIN